MNKQALINQLISMRAAIDAALCILDESLQKTEQAQEPSACQHPPGKRKDHSTMGKMIWQCGVCGYLHEEESEVS